uniref:Uncharacterized protein n=1 Tax=Triticum urartu TaxID=4572 RepID=A0A8R7Q485_TRIUA
MLVRVSCTCSSRRDVGLVHWQAVLYRGRAAYHRQPRGSFGAGRVNATGPRTYGFDLFFILF